MADIKTFFNEQDLKLIEASIAEAELNTSGEIRVHLENSCGNNVLDRAARVFSKLKMHQTKDRNGVLFYLAVNDKKFAILGDKGINEVVQDGFWDEVRDVMKKQFAEAKFSQGLAEGIKLSGTKLKEHFPYQTDDVNELSNEVTMGGNI